ncbi:hypothetical protein O9992_24265 [Vibrio lentus]|nr:hypothetical protein [Vibrio lentus]
MIGYLIQQGLNAAIKDRFGSTTILTRIVIDEATLAIADPAKFIGPIHAEETKPNNPQKPTNGLQKFIYNNCQKHRQKEV